MADQQVTNTSENYDYYLTTVDNPYDPKTQFDEWNVYDLMLGYSTLQRMAKMEDYLTNKLRIDDERRIHDAAISELVRLDPLNVYVVRRYASEPEETVHASKEVREMSELAKKL